MDEHRVADYFVVTGLPTVTTDLDPLQKSADDTDEESNRDPIVDVAVILRSSGELVPSGYQCVEFTPTGYPADLNHGSIRASEVYICYRRGRDQPPLTDIGILYDGKERVKRGCEVVMTTPYGRSANVNNSSSNRTYITYRRAEKNAACDNLVVADICVILANKNEIPPHAFCQINKTLNKGMVGSDVFLCYKKSVSKNNFLTYKSELITRFPEQDHDGCPLPDQVPMFCMPLGATIECWPIEAHRPKPVYSSFVLTVSSAERVYGAAVMFYEDYSPTKLSSSQKKQLNYDDATDNELKTVQQSKSICLLSRYPFFDTFKKYLFYLYAISVTDSHPVPIERHIQHFMQDVLFPSASRPHMLIQLENQTISLSRLEESPLPHSGASFVKLLSNLGSENSMMLLSYVLLEQKLLIHSLRPHVLTSVAEALCDIIFPLHWQCPYIPICPLALSDMLNAPIPFIVGIDSRYFDLYDPPHEVSCINLDTNILTPADAKSISYKMLPKKHVKALRATLDRIFETLLQEASIENTGSVASSMASIDQEMIKMKKERHMELLIREAFLRFMASILKGYSNFLLPITSRPTVGTTDLSSLFDVQGFLKSCDKSNSKFFNLFVKTQMFARFIEERSFVSDKDASLAFFDECVEKIDETQGEIHLLDLDEKSKSDRTVFIMPVDSTGLPNGVKYSYQGFPTKLNKELFLKKSVELSSNFPSSTELPGSHTPITHRTKQEIKSARKIAAKHSSTPQLWARCLLSHCYSLWFIHLPSYIKSVSSKQYSLEQAFCVLQRMELRNLRPHDEVCYRILMRLCGIYHQPVLAVKVLVNMKRIGIHPNAITYGYYNKAVLESKWPSSNPRQWTKLRHVIFGVAQFKRALRSSTMISSDSHSSDLDHISRASIDSSTCADESNTDRVTGSAKPIVHFNRPLAQSSNDSMKNNGLIEERASTGGMSDRGYSSMTLEDAKHNSVIVGSTESFNSLSQIETTPLKTIQRKTDSSSGPLLSQENFIKFEQQLLPKLAPGVEKECRKRRHSYSSIEVDQHVRFLYQRRFNSWYHKCSQSSSPVLHPGESTPVTGSDTMMLVSNSDHSAAAGDISGRNYLTDACGSYEVKSQTGGGGDNLVKVKKRSKSLSLSSPNLAHLFSVTDISSHLSALSPTHSLQRTPVTENDPLGVFYQPADILATPTTSSGVSQAVSSITPVLPGLPFSTPSECSSGQTNDLTTAIQSSPTCVQTAEQSESSLDANPESDSVDSLKTPGKSDVLKTHRSSIMRTESFSKVFRSTASYLTNKFGELKQNMTPIKASSRETDEDSRSSTSGSKIDLNRQFSSEYLVNTQNDEAVEHSSLDGYVNPAFQYAKNAKQNRVSGSLSSILDRFDRVNSSDTLPTLDKCATDQSSMNSQFESVISLFPCSSSEQSVVAMEIHMCTITKCLNCFALLYDEEIMADWTADDSNLNTRCQFCHKNVVPLLHINLKDLRTSESNLSKSQSDNEDNTSSFKVSQDDQTELVPLSNLPCDNSCSKDLDNSDNSFIELSPTEDLESNQTQSINNTSALSPSTPSNGFNDSRSSTPVNSPTNCDDAENESNNELTFTANESDSQDLLNSQSAENQLDIDTVNHRLKENSFKVPYLCPLVLRKEFETILNQEGDVCLSKPTFVDNHPIIYWNLIWYFRRLNVSSHLNGFVLTASSLYQNSNLPNNDQLYDSRNVVIKTIWENSLSEISEEYNQLLYVFWKKHNLSLSTENLNDNNLSENEHFKTKLVRQIINKVMVNDVLTPIKLLLRERNKKKNSKHKHHSLYRDILFLSLVSLGREDIDIDAFDREYRQAFNKLTSHKTQPSDNPPKNGVGWCRRVFGVLDL